MPWSTSTSVAATVSSASDTRRRRPRFWHGCRTRRQPRHRWCQSAPRPSARSTNSRGPWLSLGVQGGRVRSGAVPCLVPDPFAAEPNSTWVVEEERSGPLSHQVGQRAGRPVIARVRRRCAGLGGTADRTQVRAGPSGRHRPSDPARLHRRRHGQITVMLEMHGQPVARLAGRAPGDRAGNCPRPQRAAARADAEGQAGRLRPRIEATGGQRARPAPGRLQRREGPRRPLARSPRWRRSPAWSPCTGVTRFEPDNTQGVPYIHGDVAWGGRPDR